MSPRLTEDKAYDRTASYSPVARAPTVAEAETDAGDDYVFVYGMFYKAVYQKLRVPRFGVLPGQCIPGRFSSGGRTPPPHVPPRAARPAYSAAIFGEPEVWGCVIEGLRSKRALKHFEVKRRLLHEK